MTRSARTSTLGGIELEPDRLLHREVSGRPTFQYLVHIGSGTPGQVVRVRVVAHKPAGFDILASRVGCRKPVLYCQFSNLNTMRIQYRTAQYEDCVSPAVAGGLT